VFKIQKLVRLTISEIRETGAIDCIVYFICVVFSDVILVIQECVELYFHSPNTP